MDEKNSPARRIVEERIAHITEACTFCGKCFEVCPMTPYSSIKGAEPEGVVRSVIDLLNGRDHSPEGEVWALTCQKSGICIDACPEDVNPREMLAYAKLKVQEASTSGEEMAEAGRDYFQRLSRTIRLVSALQIEPDLNKHLISVHGRKKAKADIVFYFGCNILQTPHILMSCLNIFDRLGIDYEVAGGMAHCCGINHIRRGDLEGGAAMGARSLGYFMSYEPEKIVTFCPTCQMQYTESIHLYTQDSALPLAGGGAGATGGAPPFVHITSFLAERLDSLRALCVEPVRKRVALHLHGGTDGVEENVQKILKLIPGLEIVEIDQLSDHGYQCPTLVIPEAKEAMREKLFESARGAGIDSLITVYHSCHRGLCGEEKNQLFLIENFTTIIGQAMGFECHDRMKDFKLYQDVERVLEESGDLLSAYGMSPGEVRGDLQEILYG